MFFKKKKQPTAVPTDEQDKLNLKYVSQIIDGKYEPVDGLVATATKNAYGEWQGASRKLFADAQPSAVSLRDRLVETSDLSAFQPSFAPEEAGEVWFENAFTEPFPSTHDMATFHMITKATDILALSGISPEDSTNFVVVTKNHFVNHDMIRGIVHFGIYKRKNAQAA